MTHQTYTHIPRRKIAMFLLRSSSDNLLLRSRSDNHFLRPSIERHLLGSSIVSHLLRSSLALLRFDALRVRFLPITLRTRLGFVLSRCVNSASAKRGVLDSDIQR